MNAVILALLAIMGLICLPTITEARRIPTIDGQGNHVDARVVFSGEGYPYRTIGQIVFKNSKNEWQGCTGFLIGPDKILTNRHCIIDSTTNVYTREVQFFLPVNSLTKKYRELQGVFVIPIPSEFKGKWIVKEKTAREDLVSLRIGKRAGDREYLGNLIGYFGVAGLEGKRKGYVGSPRLPNRYISKFEQNYCSKTFHSPLMWLAYNKKKIWKKFKQKNFGVSYRKIKKICAAGFPGDIAEKNNWNFVLTVQNNCGLAGIHDRAARTNCSFAPGASGSVLFYFDPDFEGGQYLAVAVQSTSFPQFRHVPDGTPYSRNAFNIAVLIVPDIFKDIR